MSFVGVAPSFADDQLIDVVHLKDGTTLKGLIVDQVAGVSLKLATVEQLVYTLANQEIDRVEKQKIKEKVPFYYSDVVLLKDGVMFRGTIVEQRPAVSMVLQTENDVLLIFATDEIWKILKVKRIAGRPVERTEKQSRAERERLKIALQIELVKDRIREQEEQKKTAGDESVLEGEIDSLKEQMQTLQQVEEQIEYDVLEDRRSEEREKLEELEREIEELLKELVEMLDQCDERSEDQQSARHGETRQLLSGFPGLQGDSFTVPEIKHLQVYVLTGFAGDTASVEVIGLPADSAQLVAQRQSDEELSEQLGGAVNEIVEQTIYKIPTQEEIDALAEMQQAYATLTDVLGSSRWKLSSSRRVVMNLAEEVSVEDRVFLYETHKRKDAWFGMALNIIPAVYIGSWAQGDGFGALLGTLQTALCVAAGVGLISADSFQKGYTSPFEPGYFPGDVGTLFWAAVGVAAASYSFGFIEPFWYVHRWNTRLESRLLLDETVIREEKRESRKTALNPPALRIRPGRDNDIAVQLDLVSLSY
jgi:hypothetical protein